MTLGSIGRTAQEATLNSANDTAQDQFPPSACSDSKQLLQPLLDSFRDKLIAIIKRIGELQDRSGATNALNEDTAVKLCRWRILTEELGHSCFRICQEVLTLEQQTEQRVSVHWTTVQKHLNDLTVWGKSLQTQREEAENAQVNHVKEVMAHQWNLCSEFIERAVQIKSKFPDVGAVEEFRCHDFVYYAACCALTGVPLVKPNPVLIPSLKLLGIDIDSRDIRMRTPFFRAIKEGKWTLAAFLEQNGASIRCSKKTLSHYAVKLESLSVLDYAYRFGDLNKKDRHGRTPLEKAIYFRKRVAADFFYRRLNRPDVESIRTEDGYNLVHQAVLSDSIEMLSLVQEWAKRSLITFVGPHGDSELFLFAVSNDKLCSARWLKDQGANTNFYLYSNGSENPVLWQRLFELGCGIKATNQGECSSFKAVLEAKKYLLARWLLERGADLDYEDLHEYFKNPQTLLEIVKTDPGLMEKLEKVVKIAWDSRDGDGLTALNLAVGEQNFGAIAFLLEKRSEYFAWGQATVLHQVVRILSEDNRPSPIAQLLIERNSSLLSSIDEHLMTPLFLAVFLGKIHFVNQIYGEHRKKKVDACIQARIRGGDNLLHLAVNGGLATTEWLSTLDGYQWDFWLENDRGQTPLELTRIGNSPQKKVIFQAMLKLIGDNSSTKTKIRLLVTNQLANRPFAFTATSVGIPVLSLMADLSLFYFAALTVLSSLVLYGYFSAVYPLKDPK